MSTPSAEVTAYNANIATLSTLQKSAEEKYDAIVTTLGSAFLALSVSFVKDVVPLAEAKWTGLLYASWIAFASTIMMTVVSLGIGGRAVDWHVSQLMPTEFPQPGLQKLNPWSAAIARLNVGAGAAFLAGIVLIVVFAISNTVAWRSTMEKRIPQQGELMQKGFTMPPMQSGVTLPVPASSGSTAPVPSVPAAPPANPSASGSK